ncbi:MAG: DUF1592 domain-containing protein [Fuerstiella sp.]|nr:DUF1592 domain-containing protein [Fuerstiella sp.]
MFSVISGSITTALGICLSLLFSFVFVVAEEADSFDSLRTQYDQDVRPVLNQYCFKCHSTERQEGDLDLERFTSLKDVRSATQVWLKVIEMLDLGEMPPEDSPQLTSQEQASLRSWIERYTHAEALAGAGDPGPVVLRRLTNAEYTWTIRDLIGVALDPVRELPTEGAAGEGFTNTGNALVMSPGLLRKYLDAGKQIAAHAVLLPEEFRFSVHTTRRDWTDESLARIRRFYDDFSVIEKLADHYGYGMSHLGKAGRIPLERYFAATIAKRDSLTAGHTTIQAVAEQHDLNAKYLSALWTTLTGDNQSLLLNDLCSRWRSATSGDTAALVAHVGAWQKGLWTFNPVGLLGRKGTRTRWMEAVSPLLTQHELRMEIPVPEDGQEAGEFVVSLVAGDAGDGNEHDFVVWTQPRLVAEDQPDVLLRDWVTVDGKSIEAESVCVRAPSVITLHIPPDLAGRELVTTAALQPGSGDEGSVQTDVVAGTPDAVSGLFPGEIGVKYDDLNLGANKRIVTWRRPIVVTENSSAWKRFEAATEEFRRLFPAALCYTQIVPVDELLTLTLLYREDDHLARLMLDKGQSVQLDRLWDDLYYVSREPLRLIDVLDSLLETTIDQPQAGIFDAAVEKFNARADSFRTLLEESEAKHLDALVQFTERAWRRPITEIEDQELRDLYRRLRQLELPHEEAFRYTLARVFVAAPFLYRLEEAADGRAAVVSDRELANRLSYFLWSSMPDDELLAAAGAGRLTGSGGRPDPGLYGENDVSDGHNANTELLRQTRRMLQDSRVRRLATEFAGQWLHIHLFDPYETKSETHFPEFTELRSDMYEESIRFFTDLFQNDRSLLSLLDADHTFVNSRLGKFYGMSGIEGDAWRRVEGVHQYGRGGILGLATTLAKQSGTTRTSPILRGNWVSEVLLGEKLPRPPKNVPQLPDGPPEGLTERQLIEQHSSAAACAKCHARIDPFGFALEEFDAIGRYRQIDSRGQKISSQTTLPDGTKIEGLAGLRGYLLEQRREEFLRQFCRKLLGYALGREVQLSDTPLLDTMLVRLSTGDFRFAVAVETIVASPQFRMIRGKSINP